MIRIFPKVEDDLFTRLYHKARHSQWTSADVDWEAPLQLDNRQAQALARILTPVYLGEQAAMLGAAGVIPQVANAHETTAQLYLSTFLMDEGRHFEALTKLYGTLGHDPVGLREMPETLRYHHRLSQGDRYDWVWGILISDIFSSLFYQTFARAQPDALFGRISTNILTDESRHKAFAHYYLRWAMPRLDEDRKSDLRLMKEELIQTMEGMYSHLQDDTKALGIDGRLFFDKLISQIENHARRIGLEAGQGPDDDGSGEDTVAGTPTLDAGGRPAFPGGWTTFFRVLMGLDPLPGRILGPDGRPLAAPAQAAAGSGRGQAADVAGALEPERPRRRIWTQGMAQRAGEIVHTCTGCAVALLCKSRLAKAAVSR